MKLPQALQHTITAVRTGDSQVLKQLVLAFVFTSIAIAVYRRIAPFGSSIER